MESRLSGAVWIVAALTAAALVMTVLWHILRPAPTAAVGVAVTREFEIVIGEGAVAGPESLSVVQGDTVRIVLRSTAADEVHVHGYDLSVAVQAATPSIVQFVADRSGRFEIESHHSHARLATLEVYPRQ